MNVRLIDKHEAVQIAMRVQREVLHYISCFRVSGEKVAGRSNGSSRGCGDRWVVASPARAQETSAAALATDHSQDNKEC
jgi:hypothetical protein